MTEPIKLTAPGSSVTFLCSACFQVPVGRYPEIEFQGMDGTTPLVVRVPKMSADRQLGRAGLTYEKCVGARLTISRDPNAADASKPYWGITLHGFESTAGAAPAARPAPVPAKPTPAAAPPAAVPLEGHALYERITDYVLGTIMPKYTAAEVPYDGGTVAAIVATLYIQAERKHG